MLLVVAPLRKAGFALLVQKILQGCNNRTEGAFLGIVANSDVSRTMDSADPVQALVTCGRPKQTDISRFCSHTVQAPTKLKPFRNHSMASNPRIVRRAVWKD
jgi:hypothetical protein